MGEPKLLLPWRNRPVIEHVLAAWKAAGVFRTVVVTKSDDFALIEICARAGADTISPPVPPPDMKASVSYGLRYVLERFGPSSQDAWLLAPADMPLLSSEVIQAVMTAFDPLDPQIVVPIYAGKRGHPVMFPWQVAASVEQLGDTEGISSLLKKNRVREIAVDQSAILSDLDSPEDYNRLKQLES